MDNFFYRFTDVDLTPGSKTAGFGLDVSTKALIALRQVSVTREQRIALVEAARARLLRSGLVAESAVCKATIGFYESSACPQHFAVDPQLGGSIGADVMTLARLEQVDALDWIGETVEYSPHNLDAPQQALAVLLLAQTWTEWAFELLQRQSWAPAQPSLEALPADCHLMTLKEYDESVDDGSLTADDGTGYYATDSGMSRVSVYSSAVPAWATHVVWFNR